MVKVGQGDRHPHCFLLSNWKGHHPTSFPRVKDKSNYEATTRLYATLVYYIQVSLIFHFPIQLSKTVRNTLLTNVGDARKINSTILNTQLLKYCELQHNVG